MATTMSYLRQPSPLSFEPLTPSPTEIVLSDFESNDGPDYHIAKRRRVEDLGRQYLAGRSLFIQTASLRGPFDDGWINPWKKSKRNSPKQIVSKEKERLGGKDPENRVIEQRSEPERGDEHITARGHILVPRNGNLGGENKESRRVKNLSTTPRIPGLTARLNRTSQGQLEQERRERRRIRKEERVRQAELLPRDGLGKTPEQAVDLITPFKRPLPNQSPRALILAANKWLKSNEGYTQEHPDGQPRSPTPTPASRPDDKPPLSGPHPEPHTRMLPESRTGAVATPGSMGFTPINKPLHAPAQVNQQRHLSEMDRSPSTPHPRVMTSQRKSISPNLRQNISILHTEDYRIRKPPQEPALHAALVHLPAVTLQPKQGDLENITPSKECFRTPPLDHASSLEEARLSNVMEEPKPPSSSSESRPEDPQVTSITEREPVNRHLSHGSASELRGMVQAVPPSTTLSEFQYRRAPLAAPYVGDAGLGQSGPEPETVNKPRRLDFVSSGGSDPNAKLQSSVDQISQRCSASPSQRSRDYSGISLEGPSKSLIASENHAGTLQTTDDLSRVSSVFQEAQFVPSQFANLRQAPSAPSTDLLETDKQSLHFGTDTGDLSAHISTQAAIAKAQSSFRADLISPVKQLSPTTSTSRDAVGSTHDTSSHKGPRESGITPFRTFRTPSPNISKKKLPFLSTAEENMSTQEMIDAVTPFAFSTVKRSRANKGISFRTSPVHSDANNVPNDVPEEFGKSGLDMETSLESLDQVERGAQSASNFRHGLSNGAPAVQPLPRPSSFSIASNGTLKEVFQQDGQANGAMMDLSAVIDDVGSFLQSWDLEAELKKSTDSPTARDTNAARRTSTGMRSGRRRISTPHHTPPMI